MVHPHSSANESDRKQSQPSKPEFQTAPPDIELAVQAIRRIVRKLRLANYQVARNAGVSAAQQFILTVLAERSADSLQELAQRTLADRTSVRDVLQPLLAKNLVERQPDPVDRRRTIIRITDEGRTRLATAPEPPTALLVRGLRAMSGTDRHQLTRLLEQLVVQMGLTNDPATMLFHDGIPANQDSPTQRAESS